MSILKFLPIFIGGMLLCGCESGTVMTEPEIETLDQEISRVEKNGKIVQQVSGARPREDIYQKVKNIGGIAAYTGKVEK